MTGSLILGELAQSNLIKQMVKDTEAIVLIDTLQSVYLSKESLDKLHSKIEFLSQLQLN